jgi:hypothetical protein
MVAAAGRKDVEGVKAARCSILECELRVDEILGET